MQKTEISLAFVPFPNPDTHVKIEADGSATLINFDSGHALSLNRIGRFIWKTADGKTSVSDLVKKIRTSFAGVPDGVDSDVLEVVRVLQLEGFFGYEVKAN